MHITTSEQISIVIQSNLTIALRNLQLAGRVVKSDSDKRDLMYSFARLFSMTGDGDKAISFLEKSFELGMSKHRLIYEPAFDFISGHPKFREWNEREYCKPVQTGQS